MAGTTSACGPETAAMRRTVSWVLLAAAALVAVALLSLWWALGSGIPEGDASPATDVQRAVAEGAMAEGPGTRSAVAALSPAAPPRDATPVQVQHAATLRIQVRDEAGAPLPDCAVAAGEAERITGADGVAEFSLPEGRVPVHVQARAGAARHAVHGHQTVVGGTVRELVVVLRRAREMAFFCRLVAGEDGAPIAGARVTLAIGGQPLLADAQGLVQAALDLDGNHLVVRAPGRAPRRVVPQAGHESAATAMVVPLEPGAGLMVSVVDDAGRPLPGCTLSVRAEPWRLQWPSAARSRGPAETWQATSDAEGVARLADLPPDVPLDLRVAPPAGLGAEAVQARAVLRPGPNQRRVAWRAPVALRGRVLDLGGRPIADVSVGCAPTGLDRPPQAFPHETPGVRTGRTSGDGRFTIPGLAPGRWVVGLTAVQPSETRGPSVTAACVLHTVDSAHDPEVELRAVPALAIAGVALGPDGRPAAGVGVEAMLAGAPSAGARTDAEGRFRLAPLLPGEYRLRVDVFEDDLGLPHPVPARAGDLGVELRLIPVCGTLAGRAVDAGLQPVAGAWVRATRRGGAEDLASACDLDGGFAYRGLPAGTWDLAAHDRLGRCAWLPAVTIVAGRAARLELVLQPGAVLRPRHEEADRFLVLRGADVAGGDNLERGASGEAMVPPGEWTVVFLRQGRELSRRSVRARAGEVLSVEG